MSKYRKNLEEIFNVTSTNRGYRTIQHDSVTYEQTKKKLSNFYIKKSVQQERVHNCSFSYNYKQFNKMFQNIWVTNTIRFWCHFFKINFWTLIPSIYTLLSQNCMVKVKDWQLLLWIIFVLHGWFFFLWSFRIWYTVMGYTPPLFILPWYSQFAVTLTFNWEFPFK